MFEEYERAVTGSQTHTHSSDVARQADKLVIEMRLDRFDALGKGAERQERESRYLSCMGKR